MRGCVCMSLFVCDGAGFACGCVFLFVVFVCICVSLCVRCCLNVCEFVVCVC